MNSGRQNALRAYGAVGAHSQTVNADPHRLTLLLLNNVLERIAAIKGHLQRGEIAEKCVQVDKLSLVITELADTLNMEKGGEVAQMLKRTYEVSLMQLTQAHAGNAPEGFEQIAVTFRELKGAWEAIAPQQAMAVGQ